MSSICVGGCVKMLTVIFQMLILVFWMPPTTATLPTWNMHYSCGRTFGGSDLGGFLQFDSDKLPSFDRFGCTVYIQLGMARHEFYGILFHFANFEMPGGRCRDANLTVFDGKKRSFDSYQDYKYISGLKTPMCSSNSSLNKDLVFASKDSVLTIEFKRASYTGSSYKAKFNMILMPYHDGYCDDYEDVYECPNGRCIYNEFRCRDLNPCGDNSDCKDPEEEDLSFWETFVNSIKQYFWIIVIIAGIYILLKFIQSFRRKGGQLNELPVIGCFFDSCKSNDTSQAQAQVRRSSLSRSRSTVRDASVVMEERSLSQSSDDESAVHDNRNVDTGDQSAPPPTYDDVAPTGHPVITDMPAPPSYDEVMANNDVYTKES